MTLVHPRIRRTASLLAVLALAGCSTAASPSGDTAAPLAYSGALSGADLQERFVGQNLTWVTCRGKCRGTVRHTADGSSRITGRTPSGAVDSAGRWRIAGNRFCVEWQNSSPGDGGCQTYTWRNKSTVVSNDGVVISF